MPDDGHAQPVPVTKIENAAGDSVLTVFDDGGFAAYGEEGTGVIPVEGAGSRMMWHPAKAAFRAGEVTREEWNEANVGEHSVAFGLNTDATGVRSTAMGLGSSATGNGSTAMGNGTLASGTGAVAMGNLARAEGDESTAMGNRTDAATDQSLSIGRYNDANSSVDNTLFVAGNGSFGSRSDALVLDYDGNMTIAGTLTENSDRRLKTHIQPLGTGVLGPLAEIEPVRFQFKDARTHPSGTQVGLIAQEVQAQFPALVSEGVSGHLSVSYSKFTAVLLKGLQEQQSEIEQLEMKANRIDQLEARLAELEQGKTDDPAYAGWRASAPLGGLIALLLLAGGVAAWRRFRAQSSVNTLTGLGWTGLLVLGGLLAAPSGEALAQPVPVTDIENAAGDSVLTVFDDGAFAAYGEEGTGTIPIEGEGTRMMWHPEKAAFRAGEVGVLSPASEEWWDDANVGRRSVAFGQDTRASGFNSVAVGDRTTADGANATAMGSQTTASGGGSTAIGGGTEASGVYSTAIGSDTEASGNFSTAMGDRTEAATDASLTIGTYNDANDGSADNTLFVAGNGTGIVNQSDALVLDFDGNMTLAGSLTQNSDRRLKTHIQPLGSGVLASLAEIGPVRFQFKDNRTHPSGEQIGLIAQEVQAQFPALVSEGASGHLSVSYSKFTAVLLKGLQEQQEQIQKQQNQIERLRNHNTEIAALQAEVDALKKGRSQTAGWGPAAGGMLGLLLLGGGIMAIRRWGTPHAASLLILAGVGALLLGTAPASAQTVSIQNG
ncbi:MAG: hypothetical protein GVY25_13340, partial [Bacteroidetes bacterium]|nr:hypothetical protein [Bacteroidota bacterium]